MLGWCYNSVCHKLFTCSSSLFLFFLVTVTLKRKKQMWLKKLYTFLSCDFFFCNSLKGALKPKMKNACRLLCSLSCWCITVSSLSHLPRIERFIILFYFLFFGLWFFYRGHCPLMWIFLGLGTLLEWCQNWLVSAQNNTGFFDPSISF